MNMKDLQYPPETAGSIMTEEFSRTASCSTVEETLASIKKYANKKETIYYTYVTDASGALIGVVSLKDLILADLHSTVESIMKTDIIYGKIEEDQESISEKIFLGSFLALPIVNDGMVLKGIVTHETAVYIKDQAHTEDWEKVAAITGESSDQSYLETSSIEHFKRRSYWVCLLAIIELISGYIIHKHEDLFSQFLIIAVYLPMIMAVGGDVGTQASTLVIRALSLGEVNPKDLLKVILKELKVSSMLATLICSIMFIKICVFSAGMVLPAGMGIAYMSFTICLALFLQVISSALLGSSLPLIIAKLGLDPAVVASPAITTLVDVTGLLVYFTITALLLGI